MTRGRAGNLVAQKNEFPPQGIEPDFPVVQPWPIYMNRVNREELCDTVDFGSVRPPELSQLSCSVPAYLTSGPSPCVTCVVTPCLSLGEQFQYQGAQAVNPSVEGTATSRNVGDFLPNGAANFVQNTVVLNFLNLDVRDFDPS